MVPLFLLGVDVIATFHSTFHSVVIQHTVNHADGRIGYTILVACGILNLQGGIIVILKRKRVRNGHSQQKRSKFKHLIMESGCETHIGNHSDQFPFHVLKRRTFFFTGDRKLIMDQEIRHWHSSDSCVGRSTMLGAGRMSFCSLEL